MLQTNAPTTVILRDSKNPKDIANDIMQLAKSVKTDANKVAVSTILPRKDKFNSKTKEFNTKIYVLQITSL